MENIKMPTFIAGSLPKIVTSDGNRRINKEGVNDNFIYEFISLIGNLLLKKKNLKDIKIAYIGGYLDFDKDVKTDKNINTAKLYFNALNYFFKEFGIGEMSKNNFYIVDEELLNNDKEKVMEILNNMDLMILGIGEDEILAKLFNKMEMQNIILRKIMINNNILGLSFCAGSVLSSQNIYGGSYDKFYHDREEFNYPKNYKTLSINKVTMEPNLYPERSSNEKNNEFRERYLLKDSKNKAFFGCRYNSYIFMDDNCTYASGEIYLFIDGIDIKICKESEKVDISVLNDLVNLYNEKRTSDIKLKILEEIKRLNKSNSDNFEKSIISTFEIKEKKLIDKRQKRKELLQIMLFKDIDKLINESDSFIKIEDTKMNKTFIDSLNIENMNYEELFIKFYLISIIKKYSKLYKDNINYYFKELLEIMEDYININPLITFYFIECFSSLYENSKMKKLLTKTGIECSRKVNAMNKTNIYRNRLWRNNYE